MVIGKAFVNTYYYIRKETGLTEEGERIDKHHNKDMNQGGVNDYLRLASYIIWWCLYNILCQNEFEGTLKNIQNLKVHND